MERIKTIETRDLAKSLQNGGCGECLLRTCDRSLALACKGLPVHTDKGGLRDTAPAPASPALPLHGAAAAMRTEPGGTGRRRIPPLLSGGCGNMSDPPGTFGSLPFREGASEEDVGSGQSEHFLPVLHCAGSLETLPQFSGLFPDYQSDGPADNDSAYACGHSHDGICRDRALPVHPGLLLRGLLPYAADGAGGGQRSVSRNEEEHHSFIPPSPSS